MKTTARLPLFLSVVVFFFVVATGLAQPSAYFRAVTNLNPAGYWPMHESAPPAAGDIETNYGRLGVLGTGFYPDWGRCRIWR
jgi:hypothetical protein